MKNSSIKIRRRDFLKAGSLAIVSITAAGSLGKLAHAAEPSHVSEQDETAQSLGYKQDATKVDKSKFAKFKVGETCANCQLYQGQAGQMWGPCPIFSGKSVNAKGWCSAYLRKT